MNRADLENKVWQYLGFNDASRQQDWRRQQIWDGLNTALKIVGSSAPYLLALVREASIPIVAQTAVYTLNDWCGKFLGAWTETAAAHKVRFRNPNVADRDGSRNPNLALGTLGPWEGVWQPRNTLGAYYGLAGSTGATIVDGASTAAILGSSSTGIPSNTLAAGRMIRFNGESADYMVSSISGSTVTLDKPFKARLNAGGVGVAQTANTYTGVKWEIGPPGRVVFKVLPMPLDATTMFYRYAALPRMLLNADDSPEIPDEYHDLLWMGAMKYVDLMNEKDPQIQSFMQEFASQLDRLRNEDAAQVQDVDEAPWYTTLGQSDMRGMPRDTYSRGDF